MILLVIEPYRMIQGRGQEIKIFQQTPRMENVCRDVQTTKSDCRPMSQIAHNKLIAWEVCHKWHIFTRYCRENSRKCYNFSFSRCNSCSHAPTCHAHACRLATLSHSDLTHNLRGHITSYTYAPYAYFGILTALYIYACTRNSFWHPRMVLDSRRSISRFTPTHPLHVSWLIVTRPSTHSSRRAYSYTNTCTHLS